MREAIDTELKSALKAQDKRRVATLRLISAAIKDRDIAGRSSGKERISDDEILQLMSKMIKQREESARLYAEGGREDLATQERQEIEIIREFLPKQLSDEEVQAIAGDVVAEIEAHGLRDVGRVMAVLKERYPGQMDFAKASATVKGLLT